jgi:hypothetical protein
LSTIDATSLSPIRPVSKSLGDDGERIWGIEGWAQPVRAHAIRFRTGGRRRDAAARARERAQFA